MSRNNESSAVAQRGGPDGSLERRSLEDRDVRLARVRRRRVRAGSMVGTKNIDPNTTGPGQSGRMDRILDEGFKHPAAENVLIQSRTLRADDPAFAAAIRDVVTRVSKVAGRPECSLAVRSRRRGSDREERARRARRVRDPRRHVQGGRQDRRRSSTGSSQRAKGPSRASFIGEFGEASAPKGVKARLRRRPGKAGTLSLPITLDHPRGRRSGRSSRQGSRSCSD